MHMCMYIYKMFFILEEKAMYVSNRVTRHLGVP